MSDVYVPSFFSDDPKTGALTFEQLQARRKIANALATRNRGFPKTIGEGLTYFGESLGDAFADKKMAANEAAYRQQTNADVQRLSQPETAAPPPTVAPPAAGHGPGPMGPEINPFGAGFSEAPTSNVAAATAPAAAEGMEAFASVPQAASMSPGELLTRLARNETGAERNPYRAIGQQNRRGDYPLGKYQIMGENVPEWSKMYLGKKLTPQEFLLDDKAQDIIALGRGSEYLAKYGPEGAAEAWFAGEKGRVEGRDGTRPNLGRHLDQYVAKFNEPLVDRNQVAASMPGAQPVQLASLGGMPTPDTAPAQDPRDAIARTLEPPPPQQMAQAQPMPQPVGRPVPTTITAAPSGPPEMPRQEPMSAREMEIRRKIGSTTDPNLKGQLEPIAERMAEERKFKDTQKMELWKKDVIAYEKRTDPLQRSQLEKAQREEAEAARDRLKTEARGGVSQAVIDKSIEESAKKIGPLREGSIALNEVDDLIEKGMFSGTLAKGEHAWAKLKMAAGGAIDPRVANSERFAAAIAPIVAAARTSLAGTANISDADMRAAEKASGGDITLTKEGMQGVMKTVRQLQLNAARHHQQLLSIAAGGDPGAERTLYGLHGLPMEHIVSKNDRSVERLMQNPDNEHERGLFDKSWHTPGLAEKIIARQRAR